MRAVGVRHEFIRSPSHLVGYIMCVAQHLLKPGNKAKYRDHAAGHEASSEWWACWLSRSRLP